MLDNLKEVFTRFLEAFKELPTAKKTAIGGIGLVAMVAILAVGNLSSRSDMAVLFSGLTLKDSSEITETLSGDGVSYKLAQNGTAILVSPDHVHQLRLQFASQGLPAGGSVGFEIFNEATFGMTDFQQKLNFQRALQGELERTITTFREVRSVRVHIATPERRLFAKDQNATTASVVLKLASRARLSKSKVSGIVHLVASSVENLSPEHITVVDVEGRVLSGGEASDEMARLSSTQFEYKLGMQSEIEKRITTMLENIIGHDKVVTRVSADIDFRRVEKTEKTYDPNSQVSRSEQRSENSSTGATPPSGAVGVTSNQPGAESGNSKGGAKPPVQNSNQETINYEINETVAHIVEQSGTIKKLSVAVLVDGKYLPVEGGAEGDTEYKPRTDAELEQLRQLITSASGIDTKRGDTVTVQSAPFDNSRYKDEIAMAESASSAQMTETLVSYGGIAALIAFLFLFVLRPLTGWITSSSAEIGDLRTFPQTVEQMEDKLGMNPSVTNERVDSRERIKDLILNDPQASAEMLREWLSTRR